MPTAVEISVSANTRKFESDIQNAIGRIKPVALTLNTQGFALGRINGDVSQFNRSMEAATARVSAFGANAFVFIAVGSALRGLVENAIKVQKELLQIQAITGSSSSKIKEFGNSLFEVARKTGASFEEVAETAQQFSRQTTDLNQVLKRTQDALILVRLTGLDVGRSIQALTAVTATFKGEALDTTRVLNKLIAVDSGFAASAKDLASGLTRSSASARDAKVSFDQLAALITAVQAISQRGGTVIGNSFKSIFTRLQRSSTLEDLEKLGIGVRDLQGNTVGAVQILTSLAKRYDSLTDSQKAYTAELVGGVYNINVLKTALGDLSNSQGIYSRALNQSINASDAAIQRNDLLNKSYATLANTASVNFTKLTSSVGELTLGPAIKNLLGGFNNIGDAGATNIGSNIGQGILKGIGDYISGPGLVLAGALALKFFSKFGSFAFEATKNVLEIGVAAESQQNILKGIDGLLRSQPDLQRQIQQAGASRLAQENAIAEAIERQIAAQRAQVGANLGLGGALASRYSFNTNSKQFSTRAAGFVPNDLVNLEKQSAQAYGYQAGSVVPFQTSGIDSGLSPSQFIKSVGISKASGFVPNSIVNTNEYAISKNGSSGVGVIPPTDYNNIDLGKASAKGFNISKISAGGFVPNFAAPDSLLRKASGIGLLGSSPLLYLLGQKLLSFPPEALALGGLSTLGAIGAMGASYLSRDADGGYNNIAGKVSEEKRLELTSSIFPGRTQYDSLSSNSSSGKYSLNLFKKLNGEESQIFNSHPRNLQNNDLIRNILGDRPGENAGDTGIQFAKSFKSNYSSKYLLSEAREIARLAKGYDTYDLAQSRLSEFKPKLQEYLESRNGIKENGAALNLLNSISKTKLNVSGFSSSGAQSFLNSGGKYNIRARGFVPNFAIDPSGVAGQALGIFNQYNDTSTNADSRDGSYNNTSDLGLYALLGGLGLATVGGIGLSALTRRGGSGNLRGGFSSKISPSIANFRNNNRIDQDFLNSGGGDLHLPTSGNDFDSLQHELALDNGAYISEPLSDKKGQNRYELNAIRRNFSSLYGANKVKRTLKSDLLKDAFLSHGLDAGALSNFNKRDIANLINIKFLSESDPDALHGLYKRGFNGENTLNGTNDNFALLRKLGLKSRGFVPNFSPLSDALSREASFGKNPIIGSAPEFGIPLGVYNTEQKSKYGSLSNTIRADHLGRGQSLNSLSLTGSGKENYLPNFAGQGADVALGAKNLRIELDAFKNKLEEVRNSNFNLSIEQSKASIRNLESSSRTNSILHHTDNFLANPSRAFSILNSSPNTVQAHVGLGTIARSVPSYSEDPITIEANRQVIKNLIKQTEKQIRILAESGEAETKYTRAVTGLSKSVLNELNESLETTRINKEVNKGKTDILNVSKQVNSTQKDLNTVLNSPEFRNSTAIYNKTGQFRDSRLKSLVGSQSEGFLSSLFAGNATQQATSIVNETLGLGLNPRRGRFGLGKKFGADQVSEALSNIKSEDQNILGSIDSQRVNRRQGTLFGASFAAPAIAGLLGQFASNPQQERTISGIGSSVGTGLQVAAFGGGPIGVAIAAIGSLNSVISNLKPTFEDLSKTAEDFAASQKEQLEAASRFVEAQSNLTDVISRGGSQLEISLAKNQIENTLNNISSPQLRDSLLSAKTPQDQLQVLAEAGKQSQEGISRQNISASIAHFGETYNGGRSGFQGGLSNIGAVLSGNLTLGAVGTRVFRNISGLFGGDTSGLNENSKAELDKLAQDLSQHPITPAISEQLNSIFQTEEQADFFFQKLDSYKKQVDRTGSLKNRFENVQTGIGNTNRAFTLAASNSLFSQQLGAKRNFGSTQNAIELNAGLLNNRQDFTDSRSLLETNFDLQSKGIQNNFGQENSKALQGLSTELIKALGTNKSNSGNPNDIAIYQNVLQGIKSGSFSGSNVNGDLNKIIDKITDVDIKQKLEEELLNANKNLADIGVDFDTANQKLSDSLKVQQDSLNILQTKGAFGGIETFKDPAKFSDLITPAISGLNSNISTEIANLKLNTIGRRESFPLNDQGNIAFQRSEQNRLGQNSRSTLSSIEAFKTRHPNADPNIIQTLIGTSDIDAGKSRVGQESDYISQLFDNFSFGKDTAPSTLTKIKKTALTAIQNEDKGGHLSATGGALDQLKSLGGSNAFQTIQGKIQFQNFYKQLNAESDQLDLDHFNNGSITQTGKRQFDQSVGQQSIEDTIKSSVASIKSLDTKELNVTATSIILNSKTSDQLLTKLAASQTLTGVESADLTRIQKIGGKQDLIDSDQQEIDNINLFQSKPYALQTPSIRDVPAYLDKEKNRAQQEIDSLQPQVNVANQEAAQTLKDILAALQKNNTDSSKTIDINQHAQVAVELSGQISNPKAFDDMINKLKEWVKQYYDDNTKPEARNAAVPRVGQNSSDDTTGSEDD